MAPDLCKFRSDLDKDEKTYSSQCIIVGKKCYIDEMYKWDGSQYYHMRCKGVNNQITELFAKENGKIPIELYEPLANGDTLSYELATTLLCLVINVNMMVSKRDHFTRRIKCNIPMVDK